MNGQKEKLEKYASEVKERKLLELVIPGVRARKRKNKLTTKTTL